jgi:Ca2+-binding RTX toxin-like protein
VKVIELDSDGNTEVLLPALIEIGIDAHWPLEAAANMDPVTGAPVGTDTGDDVIVGDNGLAVFDTTSGESILTHIETTDPGNGSDDYIYAGGGSDTVLGGSGSDYIDAGTDAGMVLPSRGSKSGG